MNVISLPICHIVAACETGALPARRDGDLVIAADAGYLHLAAQGIKPDLVVGDFDSLGFVPQGEAIVRHPARKDDTDTLLAIKLGLERGYRRFHLYGCLGGRLDHTVANLQALGYLCAHGARGFLIGDRETATLMRNTSLRFRDSARGTLSVFAHGGEARDVTLDGLSYPLDRAVLTPDFPLGVSNEFTGVPATVQVGDGALLVVWSGTPGDLLPEKPTS